MTLDEQIEQAAHDGAGSYAIAYALLRIAKAIEGAGESLALAVDGVADELSVPEVEVQRRSPKQVERVRELRRELRSLHTSGRVGGH